MNVWQYNGIIWYLYGDNIQLCSIMQLLYAGIVVTLWPYNLGLIHITFSFYHAFVFGT